MHAAHPLPTAAELVAARADYLDLFRDPSPDKRYALPFPTGHHVIGDLPLTGVTLLLGRNGAGKSTILESIAACLRGTPSPRQRIEHVTARFSNSEVDLWESLEYRYDLDLGDPAEGDDIVIHPYRPGVRLAALPEGSEDEIRFVDDDGEPFTGLTTSGRGWFQLNADGEVMEGATKLLPWAHRVAYFPAEMLPLDQELSAALGLRTESPHSWSEERLGLDDHGEVDAATARDAAELSAWINALAPRFLQQLGRFEVTVSSAMERVKGAADANIHVRRDDGERLPVSELSSGQLRWLQIATTVAGLGLKCKCERVIRDGTAYGFQDNPAQLLVLIDEPELHLHPFAQSDITEWLERLHARGVRFVLATHSARLLTTEPSIAHLMRVQGGERLQVEVIDADALSLIDQYGEDLGLGRDAVYSVLAGVLVVEGIDDQRVVEHFYGDELRRRRMLVLPIHGTRNASNAGILELLADLNVPIHIMFDKLGAEDSNEMAAARRAMRRLKDLGQQPMLVPFPGPDILTGVSLESVAEAWPSDRRKITQLSEGTLRWEPVLSAYQAGKDGSFKAWFMGELGRSNPTIAMRDLIDRLLQMPDAAPTRELDEPMSALLAGHVHADLDALARESTLRDREPRSEGSSERDD